MPTLSVIVPVFNGCRYIEHAINSIAQQEQHMFDIEIIAVNDGSTDDSLTILEQLKKNFTLSLSIINLETNQGVAVARNIGIKNARGEWLAFIDQDDRWDKKKLKKQYDFIVQNKHIDYVLGQQDFFIAPHSTRPRWVKPEWLQTPQKGFVFGTLLIKKRDFLTIGMLDHKLTEGVDDVDWFVKAKQCNLNFYMLQYVVLHRSIHNDNLSQNTKPANDALLKIIRKKLENHCHD